ncbi:MAG: pilus assembly protein PilP [Deltaproteobacteria bacterium]|nr:pilus assembly protein PilP [Deltaproteobacteria bacterium]
MIKTLRTPFIIAAVPLLLLSCDNGGGGGKAVGTKAVQKEAPKPQEEAPKPVEAVVKPDEPLKNPFLSYILIKKEAMEEMKVIKGPLECCELAAFKVAAAVVAGNKSYALVSGPDNKRYIVRAGDKMGVNNGKITAIDTEGITVREQTKDAEGNIAASTDTMLKIYQDDGEGGGKGAAKRPPAGKR